MRLPDAAFMERMRSLEPAYLASDDPIVQSGFRGGTERWRREREPILEGVAGSGDILDVGCANGHLLRSLCAWAAERGLLLRPHGVDLGPGLVAHARENLPEHAGNLHVGDLWTWEPPRRFDAVYMNSDLAPEPLLGDAVVRLLSWTAPGGRVILGSYGSRSRGLAPADLAALLARLGHRVLGTATGGAPPVTRLAWVARDEAPR